MPVNEPFDDADETERPGARGRRPRKGRGMLVLLIVGVLGVMFFVFGSQTAPFSGATLETTVGELIELKNRGILSEITIREDEAIGKPKHPYQRLDKTYDEIRAHLPPAYVEDMDGIRELREGLPPDKVHFKKRSAFLYGVLLPLLPWLILILFIWFFFFRQLRNATGPGQVLSFARSRARVITPERVKTTFADVAGIDEAKEEIREVIEYLKDPARFRRLGARVPRGILLVGPPGCGKTLLAKAVAGEANVPFLCISGSDFVEMFVGVGAARVRDLFRQSREHAPSIVFLDEIDAVGRRRGTGLGGGHDEREQTLNQILVDMDGFETDESVIVFAATNRPDVLDPALLRPGRFDRHVMIDPPDVRGREEILQVHVRKVKLGPEVDLKVIARATPMFTGADLESLINEAAILSTLKKKEGVDLADLEEARDRVLWGRQKRSRVMDDDDRRIAAVHEAGHALVGSLVPGGEPVHKVTIIPRGRTGGATMWLPERERYIMPRSKMLAQIQTLFGGRAAEEIVVRDITFGAHNDIKEATDLVRRMVCEAGMSDAVGPVNYSEEEEHMFLGREIARTRNHSDATAQVIDHEVRRIVDECYARAKELITQNRDKLDGIAEALLRHETLTGQEVRALISGTPLEALRPEPAPPPVPAPAPWRPATRPARPAAKPAPGAKPLPGPSQA